MKINNFLSNLNTGDVMTLKTSQAKKKKHFKERAHNLKIHHHFCCSSRSGSWIKTSLLLPFPRSKMNFLSQNHHNQKTIKKQFVIVSWDQIFFFFKLFYHLKIKFRKSVFLLDLTMQVGAVFGLLIHHINNSFSLLNWVFPFKALLNSF